ncbi:MAG: UDP-2,4-diacetamido-2,4,6-trideoxy-beta-L-altropyranose hydrolase, partial [Betaproteobacteria bacterium]|nr:UDP-2,4-diacetamido-2,4,6-trideoxy-beta-L-altropyranose hydrolase [Betaproteobacteria bacterium]
MSGVAIRVDASTAIGSGHVMRCLSLAAELTTAGAEVRFICREHAGNLCDTIADQGGYEVHRLPAAQHTHDDDSGKKLAHAAWLGTDWADDAAQTATAIAAHEKKPDWLVVDHYALDARWESVLRSSAHNVMVIDDLADRPHACDLLLDQNLHRELGARYDGLIPSSCQLLLGPRYALLRPEFRAARTQLRNRDGTVQRILVFFGGVDAGNETAKALRAIAASGANVVVDVILGPSSPHVESTRALCATLPRARLHHAPRNIAQLMSSADLAIGATGATTWERCCLGLPAIVISLAQNQESIAHALADGSLAVYLGASAAVTPDMIAAALLELMRDPSRVAAMSRACAEITDGNGAARVARMFDIVPVV